MTDDTIPDPKPDDTWHPYEDAAFEGLGDPRGEDGYPVDSDQHLASGDSFRGMRFRVLGYDGNNFYYFPFNKKQIVCLSSGSHTLPNILNLDTRKAWEDQFRQAYVNDDGKETRPSEKEMLSRIIDSLITEAHKKGVFKLEVVRGCGVWMERKAIIVNCGDSIYKNGLRSNFQDASDTHIYVASRKLFSPSQDVLTNYDANRLRTICEALSFEKKLSGSLLAGWLVIAPICGALPYRPHIYITGASGAGKSTIRDKIVQPVLGRISLNVDGGATEPSIREQMSMDARPLVYDEAEPSPIMENVIMLARKASTRSVITKFGQAPYVAQFAACFMSIVPAINKTADENRISLLVLKKNESDTAIQEYDDLCALIDETITPEYCERMLSRTIMHMPVLMKNISIFQRAARKVMGNARASEQIGTMLAGLYFLGRTDEVTIEAAEDWIRKQDWDDHTIINQEPDAIRLIQHISGALVRYTPTSGNSRNMSVGDMIGEAVKGDGEFDKILRHYGIIARADGVTVANKNQNLSRILRGTDWEKKWNRTLNDIPGVQKRSNVYFSIGVKTDAMMIPIEVFNIPHHQPTLKGIDNE